MKNKIINFFHYVTHSTAIGFLTVAFTGVGAVYYIQANEIEKTKKAAIAACERGNILRGQLNAQWNIMKEFVLDTAATRELLGDLMTSEGRTAEATIQYAAAESFREKVAQFEDLEMVNCQASLDAGKTIYQE